MSLPSYRSVFHPALFEGQRILITGGGSGIGRCIAHELASLGAHVILTGRNQDKLEAVCHEVTSDGGQADWSAFDIREEEVVEREIQRLIAQHGPLHHLINNAGGQYPSPAQCLRAKGFEAVVRTNLTGGFLVARACFEHSMQHHGGSIVNMLAEMWRGMPGMAHSGAARAGMHNLTMTLAVEWAPQGVRVNAVAPSFVASSGLDTYDGALQELIPSLHTKVPLSRLATEAEVSAAVCFLLSPGAAFITGATLNIDGGSSLQPGMWPLVEHNNSSPFNGFHRAKPPHVLTTSDEPTTLQGGS